MDALVKMWDQIYTNLRRKAVTKNDAKLTSTLCDIANTPEGIRLDILKYYLSKCYELYNLAFMIWRKRKTHKETTKED